MTRAALIAALLSAVSFSVGFYVAPKYDTGYFNGEKRGFETAVEMIKNNKWLYCHTNKRR
jgi:hypothetical protein